MSVKINFVSQEEIISKHPIKRQKNVNKQELLREKKRSLRRTKVHRLRIVFEKQIRKNNVDFGDSKPDSIKIIKYIIFEGYHLTDFGDKIFKN